MSLLATGSIGIDDVITPFGEARSVFGGSVVYFSFAARLFSPVRLVGVAGDDFPPDFLAFLRRDNIDLAGLELRKGSRTFRWSGRYDQVTSDAQTTGIELNVLAEAGPKVPPRFADSEFVFLAATHPALQMDLIHQLSGPQLIVADTRDLWINNERDGLMDVLGEVQGAILNDAEARLFTGENNLVLAGRKIIRWGPEFVVIKKGEHGAMLVTADQVVTLPAVPTTEVKDPTGAGDSFAGGMMGYLAAQGRWDWAVLKQALARGMIMASFTIEDFSLRRIETVNGEDLRRRLGEYSAMLSLG